MFPHGDSQPEHVSLFTTTIGLLFRVCIIRIEPSAFETDNAGECF